MLHGALTVNSIYSSPEERGRNQTEDAELKGIHRQMDEWSEIAWSDQEQLLGLAWEMRI